MVSIVGFASCFKMLQSTDRCVKRHPGILPGQQTALTKQPFHELSANESETYGFHFPCNRLSLNN